MIGDAVPIRFSRRIKRTRLLPIRASPKRKRRSAVKKRISGVNSPHFKAKVKAKVGRKNKLNKTSNLASKIFKGASCYLKTVAPKSPRISIPDICAAKRKTRNSLKTFQVNLINDEMSLNSSDNKNNIEKKNCEKFVNDEKQSRRSLRLSKSSAKKKGKNKSIDLKSSKKSRLVQRKSRKQVTTLSSAILTPNHEKYTHKTKLSGRKKSARLTTEAQNQEISLHTPVSKLASATPVSRKVTRTLGHSANKKSGKLSKKLNRSRIMNSEISLHASSYPSLFETPHPEKRLEKRKSSKLLVPRPLRMLNKELPLSTPVDLLTKNPDSTLKRSSKSCKSVEPLSSKNRKKQSRPKIFNKYSFSQKKQKQVKIHQKTSEKLKKSLTNETENLPFDILTTPAFKPQRKRSMSKKFLSNSKKSSKRKLNASTSEIHVASEELIDAKKRKPAGDNVCVDNSASPLKNRHPEKSICHIKTNTKKLINSRCMESYLMPVMKIQAKVDVLTNDLFAKQSRRKVKSMPCRNKTNCSSSIRKRKEKYIDDPKREPLKRLIPHVTSPNVNPELSDNMSTKETIEEKASPVKLNPARKCNVYKTPRVCSSPVKVDCLTADMYQVKRRRAKSVPPKNNRELPRERTSAFSKAKWIKPLAPIKFTPSVNLNSESCLPNSNPIDDLTANESASCSQNVDRLMVNVSPYSGPFGNKLSSEPLMKDDFEKIPSKGTLKHKRWLLNNLKEKNGSYEDDIFENQNFDLNNQAFHFGDESDGSSVNIATPKFDCILTPALPKKTPGFKDCISLTEFLQARKTAEEYLFRRNKKRKIGNRPSSAKKASGNKKNTVQDIPEKKKLDFDEAVSKLVAVQKNLEMETEVDGEEEDSYFSDVSN